MAAKRNRRPDVDEKGVRARIKAGESRVSIARSYGMSASSLSHYCRVRGIAPAIGNLPHEERQTMPDALEVRTLDGYPSLLFGADGLVYSTLSDPPLALSPKLMRHNNMLRLIVSGKQVNVTRLQCEAWHGAPPPGAVAVRINGEPEDIRPQNLKWDSPRGQTVSGHDFVVAWQASNTVREVADRLGLSCAACYSRAQQMKQNGVPLKRISTNRESYNDLADLAREISEE